MLLAILNLAALSTVSGDQREILPFQSPAMTLFSNNSYSPLQLFRRQEVCDNPGYG